MVLVTLAVLVGSVGFNLFSQSDQVSVSTSYSIDAGGQVLQLTQEGSVLKSAKDLQGHYVIVPQKTSGNGIKLEGIQTTELVSPGRAYPHDGRRTDAIYTDTDRYIAFSSLTGYSRDVSSGKASLWYYVPAERRWIGYWQKTRRVFGYLGPSGFSPLSQPDAPRFSVPYPAPTYEYGYQPVLLRYPKAIYLLDTTDAPIPTLTTLYTAHTPGEIKGICQMRITTNAQTRRPTLISLAMVATTGQFLVYTSGGQRQFVLSREHDLARYSNIDLSMTPDGQKFFFWYKPSDKAQKAAGGSLPEYMMETNAIGTVTHRYTLPPLPVTPEPPQDTKPGVLGLLAPPLLTLTFYGISHREISRDTLHLPLFYLSSVLSLLSGIISAGLMALISRRGGDTRRAQIIWAVVGLPPGLFGVLMLLALHPWPVRVPCPNCGRPRAVDRDKCPHCGAGFPRPARDGTEIFDREAEKNPALEVPG